MITARIAAFAFAFTALAGPLAAQSAPGPCRERDFFVEQLTDTYEEEPVAGGLQSDTALVEIWASRETGTFTILVTGANGRSCVVFTGDNFRENLVMQPAMGEAS